MESIEFTTRVKRYTRTDPRLGRHVNHDSRSLLYQAPRRIARLVSARHASAIPTLDQGELGSCTGNAGIKCLASPLFWPAVDGILSPSDSDENEELAVDVYSEATTFDSYKGTFPPTDTGSDGLSVAKVLKKRGLISGYRHATSMGAVLAALVTQAVIVGTEWREGMYDPEPDGRVRISGTVSGGHEYVLDEIDVENQRVWMQNSWGDGWGTDSGRAWFTWVDFSKLLDADGDCTVFVPTTMPAPTPAPFPEDPTSLFVAQAQHWVDMRHTSRPNVLFERQVQTYLAHLEES